mgnify:CR=1 FL=1
MKTLNLAAAAVFATLAASAATAATYDSIPGGGTNEALTSAALQGVLDPDANGERGGWYGASLYLNGGPADVTVEFLGREADFNNSFHWGDSLVFRNSNVANNTFNNGLGSLTTVFTNVASGLLDFAFGLRSDVATLFNGANPDGSGPSSVPNFFVSFGDEEATGGSIAYLFLDDGAAGPDDNHDDMVIRLSVNGGSIDIAPIPVPAAGFLLLGGLGALGAMARRRKSA